MSKYPPQTRAHDLPENARIAIVADTDNPTPPCGACRQILWEFGGDLEIVLANLSAVKATYRLAELLPLPFDDRLFWKKG